ncbi:MAG: hypothetical protein KGP28_12590, partial [Bdellovibrionales bacterium]|nr:hypothetical protein [Bdellovibrionales bacterium]
GAVAIGTAMVIIMVFFTGFFQDGSGILKFFTAFLKWFQTGTKGNGHEKPFFYWVELFVRFEWPALIGLMASPVLPFLRSGFVRINAWCGVFLMLVYSLVAYKTPWCVLSFIVFLLISFGIAMDEVLLRLELGKRGSGILARNSLAALLVMGGGYLGYRALDVAYLNPDQDEHPYIYGQTYHDFIVPVNRLLEQLRAKPEGMENVRIQVLSTFTWPLPYLLGEVKQIGYYGESNAPSELDADYLLIDENLLSKYENRIKGSYNRETVRTRQWAPKMVFLTKVAQY